jgi:hypothetical protein
MAEPFDTIAAQIAEIIKDVSDGAMTEAAAAAALIPLISGLAPVQWEQLAKVIQVLGRVEGQLFTDGVPADTLGVVGSTAIDLTAKVFYGPKTVDGWVTSFSMVGSTGPTGATGATGPTGPTGTVSAAGDGTAGAPGIAFASDPDTGIFRPGSNILGISTGGTERARIDASGNFGIGETSPSAMLHVGNASTTALRVAPASGNVTLTAYQDGAGAHGSATLNAAAWIFQSRSTEAMQVADGGNVGIGTTAPGTKLDVAGVIRTSGGSVPAAANNTALSYVAGSTGQIIIHGPDNSTPGAFQIIGLSANDSAGDIRLGVGSTGHITPGVDNAQNFGSGAARWAQGHFGIVYTADGTVSTSDLRQKVLREGGRPDRR